MEKEKRVERIEVCPECNSSHIQKDKIRAEIVCQDCGFVIEEEMIDHGPEWRAFDKKQRDDRAHTGPPMDISKHDKGLSTTIGWQNRDSYGKSIPTRNIAQIRRIRKWQRRIRISDSTERNLALAFSELNRMTSGVGLSRIVRETAAMIYRKAVLNNLIRGRSIDGVVAAALYAACRQCNVPRTLDEIAKASSSIPRKEIGRIYRLIARKLELKLMPTAPQDYVPRFCDKLNLSNDVRTKTVKILKATADAELASGRGPIGLVAASIYISSILCEELRTQREIADVAGVTEVTIRNRYKEIANRLGIEMPVWQKLKLDKI